MTAPRNPHKPGSKQWAYSLRQQAKHYSGGFDRWFYHLGEILHNVRSTEARLDGVSLYEAWGFESFNEWVEAELKIGRRKSDFLLQIHTRLRVDLVDMPEAVRRRLYALGFSKLRSITSVLTVENASQWAAFAEPVSSRQVQDTVVAWRNHGAGDRLNLLSPQDPVEPVVEAKSVERFYLEEAQQNTLRQALQKAALELGTNSRARALMLLCLEFMTTTAEQTLEERVSRFEKVTGKRVVVIDPEVQPQRVVAGLDVLSAFSASHRKG